MYTKVSPIRLSNCFCSVPLALIMNACYTHSFTIVEGMPNEKTAIVSGAQQGIGAGLVQGFLKAGFKVVATSLRATSSLTASADSFSSMVTSASRTRLQKNATCGRDSLGFPSKRKTEKSWMLALLLLCAPGRGVRTERSSSRSGRRGL